MFGVEVNNVDIINRKIALVLQSGLSDYDCCKVNIISDLLCVKYHYIHLAMLSSDEVDFVIETVRTS